MATKSDQNGATKWRPPRGIRYFERPGRPKAFLLEWRTPRGERKAQAFSTAEDREEVAKDLVAKRGDHGREILDFDPREWRRWLAFRAELGEAIDPMVVLHEWRTLREARSPEGLSLSVASAVARYMELRRSEGPLSDDTLRHFRKHLEQRFAGQFGNLLLRDVTPDMIRAWLAGLKNDRTDLPAESLTRRHHRKDLNTFLKRAVLEGWILRNPCEVVKPPPMESEDVTVMPVAEVRKLFAMNRDQPCVGRLALEAFGGLRYSSAARIRAEHLDFAAKGIAMPGMLHKSRKRKYRQGQPDNLWLWMKHAPEACWGMTVRQYLLEKGRAFVRAGVEFPRNVLRHSFASYHLARWKNPPLTAYLMQHTRTSTTEIYEGVAREKEARGYFAIVP